MHACINLVLTMRLTRNQSVGAQLPPWLFIEVGSFGGGTQNQTGVKGFLDMMMIHD